jgi:hypothetical protein
VTNEDEALEEGEPDVEPSTPLLAEAAMEDAVPTTCAAGGSPALLHPVQNTHAHTQCAPTDPVRLCMGCAWVEEQRIARMWHARALANSRLSGAPNGSGVPGWGRSKTRLNQGGSLAG